MVQHKKKKHGFVGPRMKTGAGDETYLITEISSGTYSCKKVKKNINQKESECEREAEPETPEAKSQGLWFKKLRRLKKLVVSFTTATMNL